MRIEFIVLIFLLVFLFVGFIHDISRKQTPCEKLPYSIVDANGVEHRMDCMGYTLLSADSVELCNGVKIKYSKKKPIDVIPK